MCQIGDGGPFCMNVITLMSVSAIWGKIWPILIAVVFFGFLIFFHELGHFSFAKLFHVQVNEFALGMGPSVFKFKKGETLYALRILPIGGYCAMEGEDGESENTRAFSNQKAWKRFIIVVAGGTVNLIMGIIIVAIMLGSSELVGLPQVNFFDENAVSNQSGLKEGDIVKKIDNKHVFCDYDLGFLLTRKADGVYDFVVERDGETILLKDVTFKTEKKEINGKEMSTVVYDFSIVGVPPTFRTVLKNTIPVTLSYGRLVYLSLFDLVTGRYGVSDLSGPIGTVSYIADAAETAATETNWEYLFMLMAVIAINLGIMNLLPLPALDGGRLLFIVIEMIFRKPIPRKYEGWVHAIGMVLLLSLMAVVSASDIWKLIKG